MYSTPFWHCESLRTLQKSSRVGFCVNKRNFLFVPYNNHSRQLESNEQIAYTRIKQRWLRLVSGLQFNWRTTMMLRMLNVQKATPDGGLSVAQKYE